MHPSYSYESQLPGMSPMNINSFGLNQAGASFSQTQPLKDPTYGGQYASAPTQNQYVSAPTYGGPGPSGTQAPECQDECVEEECDPDQCGDEQRGPKPENCACGVDTRPLLPMGLVFSTLAGGICMLVCQLPLLNSLIGGFEFVLGMFIALFSILYLVTLCTTVYCATADPGMMRPDHSQAYAAMEEVQLRQGLPAPLPKRAHKTWLYRQPVRRYDHYCRWVTNCIGLLNHREFFVMLSGLVLIAVLGVAIDLVSLIAVFSRSALGPRIAVISHLFYSIILMYLVGPILCIHVGLVCRNELASEWKRNDFYVIMGKNGELIPVNSLTDEEFNARFDDGFTYDRSKNVYDKGMKQNCWNFWCIPRWPPQQMGEF